MSNSSRYRGVATAVLLAGVLALGLVGSALAEGSRDHVAPSTWWPRVEKIKEAVESGRWKSAARQSKRLQEEVLRRSWHGSDLLQVLTELAYLQALAQANLEDDRQAIWYWHMAINLDFRVVKRDLTPYGRAARLLLEFPLRRKGTVPAGFDPPASGANVRVTPAEWPRHKVIPTILNNTGAALEHRGDFHVEVIVDEQGRPHQPVVISSHLHPVIVYASLKYLFELPPFIPPTVDGQPGDLQMTLQLQFEVSRW